MVPLGIRYTGSQQGCLLTCIAGNYKSEKTGDWWQLS